MSSQSDEYFDRLKRIRTSTGQRTTIGIEDDVLRQFIRNDSSLRSAIDNALETLESLDSNEKSLLKSDEAELVAVLLERYVNFYPAESVNPYVPLAAFGPWIISTHGAVLHDSGGYGMLGLGHCPKVVNDVISKPWVMANVMTASLSQKRFSDRLLREIGHTQGKCPFTDFICMNSGSEAVTVTSRIVDIHAKKQTDPGAPHAGKSIRTLALKDGFHGSYS